MQWTWDPEKNRINQREHGVGFETASLVFNDPLAFTQLDDFYVGELRWQTLGMVGGAILFVVHTWPGDYNELGLSIGRIISARRATAHERRKYEEGLF